MATKVKLMKFLQEIRGLVEISRRHPTPRPTALFLMQLRSHMMDTNRSKRRLLITIDLKDREDIPNPVKITHVKTEADTEVNPSAVTAPTA
jgi:hypothetical protein